MVVRLFVGTRSGSDVWRPYGNLTESVQDRGRLRLGHSYVGHRSGGQRKGVPFRSCLGHDDWGKSGLIEVYDTRGQNRGRRDLGADSDLQS